MSTRAEREIFPDSKGWMDCYVCGCRTKQDGICWPCRSGLVTNITPERAEEVKAATPFGSDRGRHATEFENLEIRRLFKAAPGFGTIAGVWDHIRQGRFQRSAHRCPHCRHSADAGQECRSPEITIDNWRDEYGTVIACPFWEPRLRRNCPDHGPYDIRHSCVKCFDRELDKLSA